MRVLWSIPADACSLYSRLQLHPGLDPALLVHAGSDEGCWSIGVFTLAEHLLVSGESPTQAEEVKELRGEGEAVRGDQVSPIRDDSEFYHCCCCTGTLHMLVKTRLWAQWVQALGQ